MMSKVEKFGKYLLLEKLAVGGMAEVYLAKSSGINGVNKLVAIKRILPQFTNNPDFISMFKEEAKVAINLSHSNIVSIYDFGIEDNQFFIVMEFVEGRNLRQIINEMKKSNKGFSIDQAVYMIKETAAGLNHAHRCVDSHSGKPLNITHRDMSPQNIMISFEGETKVIDFGIAKTETETEMTKAGTLKGKFSYMSPEQAEGYPIDPRTDVFALGIILWELLANDRLFTGSNEGAILRKIRECQVPSIRKINPLVPQELERIVMKALAKDKNVRYQTAANFHKDLNLFLNTQYPDFSIHDFSQFIRDCFKVAYAEGKEKLIAFAKIQISDLEAPASQDTMTATAPKIKNPAPLMSAMSVEKLKELKSDQAKDELSEMTSPSAQKINLEGLRSASMAKKSPANDTRSTYTQTYNSSQTSSSVSKNRKNYTTPSFTEFLPRLALMGVIAFAGWFGYKNYFTSELKKPNPSVAQTKNPKVVESQIDMAATASTRLSLSSEPSGAKIFIDNESVNQFTPAIVTVTANKQVKVTLIKEGYYKYEIVKEFNGASSLTATLTPTPAMGYINIYVLNGGDSSIITINGVRLSAKPPINQYAVPANTEIEVQAVNPINNLKDKAKIKVMANKTQTLQLILGRVKK